MCPVLFTLAVPLPAALLIFSSDVFSNTTPTCVSVTDAATETFPENQHSQSKHVT